jgi:small subunit ribosomal protein S6
MRRYETIVIVDADVPENDRVSLFNRIQEIIPQQEGVLIKEDLWGVKKLAYEIKRKPRGFYARYDYCGMGPLVDELERFFRIDDRVLKYLTVQLDADADAEKILAAMEAPETGAAEDEAGEATPAKADDASAAGQEAPAATETTEPAKETSEKE